MRTFITGSCLCGKVQYEVTPPFLGFWYCHCERCRKSYGTEHASHIFMDPKQLRWISGQDHVTLYKRADAEDYPRSFCKTCGAPVPRFSRDGTKMVVQAGSLDADPGIRPSANIFWPLRAPWDTCGQGMPCYDQRPPVSPSPKK